MGDEERGTEYEALLFQLLEQAAAWPEAERRERAEAACRTGPISAEVLLDALGRGERLEEFLESPAWQDSSARIAELARLDEPSVDGKDWHPGQTVGRFRLIRPIGRGGMGQVFLAEQEHPYRKVALKLMRSGGLSSEARRRFHVEQQALARLNHPHIAQLYEADLTDDGAPFCAMEWVDGEPIDAFLRERPLDLADRLRLFLDVCSAVRHAHQKQIVHRDLKPSNVLVREVEGEPVAKVIDFGIASLDATEAKEHDEGGNLYGTPGYLSPEAFDGDVDTRSDVYSLGVLLYELLAGAHPFHRPSQRPDELRRRILRGDVASLSQAAAALDPESPTSSPIRGWAPRLRGDLDAVVAKAMHPEREGRYDSVSELATDLERFLASEPVRARKASGWHLVRLLARRRRTAMIAAVVALLSVLVGALGLGYGLVRAQQEAAETRQALGEAEELSDFLIELFRESDPTQAQGRELTARDLLAKGRERLESEALADQPLTRARLSRTIGDVYADLGDFEDAETLLLSALRIFEQETGERSTEVAATLHDLGMMKTKAVAYPESQAYYERALEIQETSAEPQALALTVYHLGVLAARQNELETARAHFERACPLMEGLGDEALQARCLEAFGYLLRREGSLDEARPWLEEALSLRKRVLGPAHPHVATSHASLCQLERQLLQLSEAETHCVRALEIRKKSFEPGSPQILGALEGLTALRRLQGRLTDAETLVAEAFEHVRHRPEDRWRELTLNNQLAWLHWRQGRYSEAGQHYAKALALSDDPESSTTSAQRIARLGLGLTAWKLGRLDEAERRLLQMQEIYLARSGADSTGAAWTYWGLAGVYRDRAGSLRDQAGSLRDLERAGELYLQALEIRQRQYPEGHEHRVLAEDDYAIYLSKVASLPPETELEG